MSNIQTGAERMPHDLSHLGFLAGQIGRLITISTTPVIAGDSFEMDAVGALRLSPLRRGLAIDSTVDIFTFRSEERFSRNAETDIVCRLLLEKKKPGAGEADARRGVAAFPAVRDGRGHRPCRASRGAVHRACNLPVAVCVGAGGRRADRDFF